MATPLDNTKGAKYQGREIQATIQAPDKSSLEELLAQLSRFSSQNGLDRINVLDAGPDPDGGYKAVVEAHNWNPVKWVKEKFSRNKSEPEPSKMLPESNPQIEAEQRRQGEEAYRRYQTSQPTSAEEVDLVAEVARNRAEAEAILKAARDAKGRFTKKTQSAPPSPPTQPNAQQQQQSVPPPPQQASEATGSQQQNENAGGNISWEEFSHREGPDYENQYSRGPTMNKKQQKERAERLEGMYVYGEQTIPNFKGMTDQQKAEALFAATKGMPEARQRQLAATYRQAAQAATEAGIPFSGYEKVKQYQPGYYVRDGKPVPNSEAGKPGVEYVPGQTVTQNVQVTRSPAQVMYEAEQAKTGLMALREVQVELKGRQSERKWAPVKKVGNVAKEVMNVAVLGAAGVAQGMRPGRGGPTRAAHMLAPSVDPRLYSVARPQAPVVARPRVDLSPLRSATMPHGVSAQVHKARKLRLF